MYSYISLSRKGSISAEASGRAPKKRLRSVGVRKMDTTRYRALNTLELLLPQRRGRVARKLQGLFVEFYQQVKLQRNPASRITSLHGQIFPRLDAINVQMYSAHTGRNSIPFAEY